MKASTWAAGLALLALTLPAWAQTVGTWGPTPSETEAASAPASTSRPWVNTTTRAVALFDDTRAEWQGPPALLVFDRNGNVSDEFLRFGGNGVPGDTTGAGTANQTSSGPSFPYRSRCLGLWATQKTTDLTAAPGSLFVWTTRADASAATLELALAFTGAPITSWLDSTFVLEAEEVLSVSMKKTGVSAVANPIVQFRFVEIDTIP